MYIHFPVHYKLQYIVAFSVCYMSVLQWYDEKNFLIKRNTNYNHTETQVYVLKLQRGRRGCGTRRRWPLTSDLPVVEQPSTRVRRKMQRAADVTTELHSAVQQLNAAQCICVLASSSLIQLVLSDLGQNGTIELKHQQHKHILLCIFYCFMSRFSQT